MTFTSKIETYLTENKLREVIDEFMKFLSDCPVSNIDAKADANNLKGQIIVLAGRYNSLNEKINLRTISEETANTEKSALQYSLFQILSQIPSSYPALNEYMRERDEEIEWKEAKTKNTIDAYNQYFTNYPNGKYKSDTVKLIAELEEVNQKREEQIKKLAQEEKERRDRDKREAEETLKRKEQIEKENNQRTTQTINDLKSKPVYVSNESHQSVTEEKRSFLKSRKGLLITGAVLVIIILIIMKSGSGTKNAESNTIVTDSTEVNNTDSAQVNTTVPSANDIINGLELHVYKYANDKQGDQVSYGYYVDGDSVLMDQIDQIGYQRQDGSFPEFQNDTYQLSSERSTNFEFKTYQPEGAIQNVKVYLKLKNGSESSVVTKTTSYDKE